MEWDLKKQIPRNIAKSIRGAVPKVPQQTNYSDCGVFVLQYAETFFEVHVALYCCFVHVKCDKNNGRRK